TEASLTPNAPAIRSEATLPDTALQPGTPPSDHTEQLPPLAAPAMPPNDRTEYIPEPDSASAPDPTISPTLPSSMPASADQWPTMAPPESSAGTFPLAPSSSPATAPLPSGAPTDVNDSDKTLDSPSLKKPLDRTEAASKSGASTDATQQSATS